MVDVCACVCVVVVVVVVVVVGSNSGSIIDETQNKKSANFDEKFTIKIL